MNEIVHCEKPVEFGKGVHNLCVAIDLSPFFEKKIINYFSFKIDILVLTYF